MKAQPLKGFRDYLPEEMIPREEMIEKVQAVFRRFGFSPLATPALEYAEVLLGKYGEDAEMLIYRFQDHGGRDVALRYDLTVPLARVVASYPDLKKPFKRYQVAPVWRGESPGPGRFREFYQCDVDIVGTSSLLADAECIQVDQAVLRELGVPEFRIRINNRKVLDGLAEILGLAKPPAVRQLYRTIDKLEARGEAVVRELLARDCGLAPDRVDRVFEYLSTDGDDGARLTRLERLFESSEVGRRGAAELREVRELAIAGGVDPVCLSIDPGIARGLDYYTGTIFETNLVALPRIGSVMSGGRYDGLIGTFTGQPTPAVGISVGIDRLLAALLELDRVARRSSPTRVLVTVFDSSTRSASLRVADQLRRSGIETEIYLEDDKVGKQFKYADRKSIPLVVVLGPDEVAVNRATLKDLRVGEQSVVDLTALVESVGSRLGDERPANLVVHFLVPVLDRDGHPYPRSLHKSIRGELEQRFGGWSLAGDRPLPGTWIDPATTESEPDRSWRYEVGVTAGQIRQLDEYLASLARRMGQKAIWRVAYSGGGCQAVEAALTGPGGASA